LLNGGIILTGGGSQLKHLIQLTEYTTGLNARIGLPNEHLAPNHIDELKKPMYSTCLGLILKGYNDFERNNKKFTENFKKVEVPKSLTVDMERATATTSNPTITTGVFGERKQEELAGTAQITGDKYTIRKNFWDSFKQNLIEIFAEDDDKTFQQ
jgi:cell division protein FtsA